MTAIAQWQAFQDGAEPRGMDAQVLESWKRSRWHGVDPVDVEIPSVEVPDDSPFMRAARPVMRRTAEALAGSSTALALADGSGSVLWRWTSDAALAFELDAVDMRRGSSFDESLVGTNGIGTALSSGRAAVVVGANHFVGSFHLWACAAGPVRHPVTGRVLGAVNVTCRVEDANRFFRLAAQALSDEVQTAVDAIVTAAERRLHDAYRAHQRRTSVPLVAMDARTLIADRNAATLSLDHRRVWRQVRTARTGAQVELEGALTATVSRVDDRDPSAGVLLELSVEPDEVTSSAARGRRAEVVVRRVLSPLEYAEFEVIAATMAELAGNKTSVAERLQISRGTLYQKLRYYQLL
ncbi:Acetoin dehydrogenase operon transcriptional activator AcoR [Pseudonocardia autotrophica]|nr:Acetoin dehydrogenase operon transcriptional activator AcoR [Pseudonocardia autotrophica]